MGVIGNLALEAHTNESLSSHVSEDKPLCLSKRGNVILFIFFGGGCILIVSSGLLLKRLPKLSNNCKIQFYSILRSLCSKKAPVWRKEKTPPVSLVFSKNQWVGVAFFFGAERPKLQFGGHELCKERFHFGVKDHGLREAIDGAMELWAMARECLKRRHLFVRENWRKKVLP